ncbi:hypothetical protein ACGFXB_16065 [Streptomyces canus]|uniref:hypothetical protein n=1 Tax=Streptomyces canus TaxID=58343 RepID=UPI0037174A01
MAGSEPAELLAAQRQFTDRGRQPRIEPGVTTTELGAGMRDAETRASLSRMRTDLEPLTAPDIAEAIAFSVAAPPNVNVAEMVVVPVRQG